MTTFYISFAVIENVLPQLYHQEFLNEFAELEQELLVKLERELSAELDRAIEVSNRMRMRNFRISDDETLEWWGWDRNYCLIVDESEFETSEAFIDWYDLHCSADMVILAELDWERVRWYDLRTMKYHYLRYGSTPFQTAQQVFRDFAMTHNLKITVRAIEPDTAWLAEVIFQVDGRGLEDHVLLELGDVEITSLQTNRYDYEFGGFALVAEGTFQPAYRVLNIIFALQQQILIAIFFVSILIATLFSLYLARPIVRLSKESKKLSELEFDESLKINRRDEIGTLSSNLNFMSYKLKHTLDDLQTANERLKREMEREREQERQRRNLFASISHELKTPITILKGEIGGMIDQVGAYKDRDSYLESAYGWTETLEKLVSEILTISRLEGEKMRLNLVEFDISALLTEICHTHQSLADNQKISFEQEIDTKLMIKADESQLQIAISNVINNAIFYTQPDHVVAVVLKREEKFATLVVTNTGAHIMEDELKNLFDPFYRVDKSRNRHTGGSGLGLFIVKNILELHGFEYGIENIEEGVQFVIKMPLN